MSHLRRSEARGKGSQPLRAGLDSAAPPALVARSWRLCLYDANKVGRAVRVRSSLTLWASLHLTLSASRRSTNSLLRYPMPDL